MISTQSGVATANRIVLLRVAKTDTERSEMPEQYEAPAIVESKTIQALLQHTFGSPDTKEMALRDSVGCGSVVVGVG